MTNDHHEGSEKGISCVRADYPNCNFFHWTLCEEYKTGTLLYTWALNENSLRTVQ